jgi:hypothetical protein
LKIRRLNWDKEKHGLVWKISNVFKEYEMEHILAKLPENEIKIPKEHRTLDKAGFTTSRAAYRASSLPALEGRMERKLKELYPTLRKEYRDEGVSVYADNYAETKDNWDTKHFKLDMSLQGTPKGMNYQMHTDVDFKFLTALVYIAPECSEPTYFHAYPGYRIKYREEDKNPIMAVPWEINAGYIFLAGSKSQHSYSNNIFNTDRYVILANLVSDTDKMQDLGTW